MDVRKVMKFLLYLRCLMIFIVSLGTLTGQARGDALVVTQAMRASTIAEVSVEQEQIRVELEVGVADLKAFKNVLPNELYKKVTGEIIPLENRLAVFLGQDWLIQADGKRLTGRVERIELTKRVVRDEVTGEPVVDQPEDAEIVIRVELDFPLENNPTVITIRPPVDAAARVTANIGFVCYHAGLPVNDFRYLSGEVTLDLEWDDPWYSQFRHNNLRRKFDAPLSVFLYVEPYEVRKEIIVRPKDLQEWVDLGLDDAETIPVEGQKQLKQRVAEFLADKSPVTIDGQVIEGHLDRIHFIRRSLRQTGIVEPPEEMDTTSATLGVIYVYPVAKLPEKVSLDWELFNEKIQEVPAVASDEAGGLPARLSPDNRVLEWQNFLTNPTKPGMVAIAKPLERDWFWVLAAAIICGLLVVAMLYHIVKQRASGKDLSRPVIATMMVALLCGVVSTRMVTASPFRSSADLSAEETQELISGVLYNVYRAFDHHDESLIYDRLAQSIDGDLLSEVYLDTRRSMEVKNQGGLRVSVKEVTVSELERIDPMEADSERFRCNWRVAGSIGHWGHIHRRINEHTAHLTIASREGRWKITSLEMLDEQAVAAP